MPPSTQELEPPVIPTRFNPKLYAMLAENLKFDFAIRFRANIMFIPATGETRPAADWGRPGGCARTLRGASITAAQQLVATVVRVQDKGTAHPWCLAASSSDNTVR